MADETQPDPAAPAVAPTEASSPDEVVVQPEAAPAGPDPSQFKKDELVTAANVQGVEVEKGDTKADIAEKLATPAVQPVLVNQYTRRSGDDALLGSWVDVVSGEHEGRRGQYVDDASHDPQTGYPDEVLVRTRDANNELLAVKYADIRPSAYTGGR